jgi:hypothetical protein
MDRKVIFSMRVSPLDVEWSEEKKVLEFWIETVGEYWAICMDMIFQKTEYGLVSLPGVWADPQVPVETKHGLVVKCSGPITTKTILDSMRVTGKREDLMLAKAANSCDPKTSEDIAHRLFWTYVVEPSIQSVDNENWFRTNAIELWEFYFGFVNSSREGQCKEIQES